MKSFSEGDLSEIFEEGARRYGSETPPGYKDASKGEPDRYGDLVIWKEILRKAADGAGGYLRYGRWKRRLVAHRAGKRIGPRVELIEEFARASGQRIHFYSPEQFLRFAKDTVSATVSDIALGEVEKVSQSRLSERRPKDCSREEKRVS